MKIGEIQQGFLFKPETPVIKKADNTFADIIGDFIKETNNRQLESNQMLNDFAEGKVEVHEVMIAAQKAKTSLELLMELRNKAVDMYRELTRMQ